MKITGFSYNIKTGLVYACIEGMRQNKQIYSNENGYYIRHRGKKIFLDKEQTNRLLSFLNE